METINTKELEIVNLGIYDEIFSECLVLTSKKNPNVEIYLCVSNTDGEVTFNVTPGDSTKIHVRKLDEGMSYRPSSEYSEQKDGEKDFSIRVK